MERLPSRETTGERKEKELNKKAWGKFRTILLAGSILANGGFIGDKVHQSMRVQNLEKGGSQSFSVDFGGEPEDGLDLRGKWGERAEFSLQKGADNQWILAGKISAKNAPGNEANAYVPLHAISYELPSSLTATEAEALFKDLQARAKNDANDLGDFEATLNRAIDLSEKGDVTYYNPATGKPKQKFEFSPAKGEVLQTEYFNDKVDEKGNPVILSQYPISLGEFETGHQNPVDNYEDPEQRERIWNP